MSEVGFRPRLNHVGISVDSAVMDDGGRAALLDFFTEVFGWTEGDNTGESGNPLILYTGAPRQFLYLLPADPPMVAPSLDHFGLEVSTRQELVDLVERARAYQARDDRVHIIGIESRTTRGPAGDYSLTNAYLGYLLPLMIELQHIARQERPAIPG